MRGSTPKGRNVVCRKMSAWVGQYEQLKRFFVCGPKFTQFSSPDVEWVVVDKILFRVAIYWSVPEIFSIEVENCQKSRWILELFSRSQILGGGPSKSYTYFITPASQHVAWKKFFEDTPTSPEVIGAHTLNYKPNFKFFTIKFFWGPPFQLGYALARLGQSVARVKIWGGSTH